MLNNNRFLEKITSRTKIYLAIIAFLLIIICINKPVFIVPGIILFILIIIYSYWTNSKRNAELSRQIQNLTMTMDGTAKKSLINSPFPLIIIETTGNIIWKSSKFVYEFANIDINNYLIDILEEIKEDIEAQQDKKQKTITKKIIQPLRSNGDNSSVACFCTESSFLIIVVFRLKTTYTVIVTPHNTNTSRKSTKILELVLEF